MVGRKTRLAMTPGSERVNVSEGSHICLHSRGRMEVFSFKRTQKESSLCESFSGVGFGYESKKDPLSVGI